MRDGVCSLAASLQQAGNTKGGQYGDLSNQSAIFTEVFFFFCIFWLRLVPKPRCVPLVRHDGH